MHVFANIQAALNQENADKSHVILSLPTRDTVFRSFIIPWMQSSEIKNVVSNTIVIYSV